MHHLTFPTIASLLLILSFTMVFSATLPHAENLQPVTFQGDYGGHAYELNGTVHSVMAQLKALYPEVELPKRDINDNERLAKLNKRNKIQPPLCIPIGGQPSWGLASVVNVNSCIKDLITLNSRVLMQPGPSNCGTICCVGTQESFAESITAEVLLCNDNTWQIAPASPYLASYAADLVNTCSYWLPDGHDVGGQEFDTDLYNVVVRSSRTCVPFPN